MSLLSLCASLLLFIAPQGELQQTDNAKVIAKQLPSYPMTTCVVSNEGLHEMGEPIDLMHEGRLVRLCCKGCVKQFKKNPQKALVAIDAAVIKQQMPGYALKTCVVSGEALSEIEDPISHVHGTRLVRLCCKMCLTKFEKAPDKYMPIVDAALMDYQRKSYPMETCVVSSEGLEEMGEPKELLYGTRLVRLCCKGCVKRFHKAPMDYVAKLDEAAAAKNPGKLKGKKIGGKAAKGKKVQKKKG